MATSIQTRSVTSRPTNWTDGVTLDQIDPALGIQSISLSLTGTLDSTVTVANFDLAAGRFTSVDTGSVTLERPDGSALLTAGPVTTMSALLQAGPMAPTVLTATASASASVSYGPGQTSSADAALLVGTGTVALPVAASARVAATGPGNLRATFASRIGADVSIEAQTVAQGGSTAGSTFGITYPVHVDFNVQAALGFNFQAPTVTAPQILLVADDTTGATSALTLAPFDPTLGRLVGVNISVAADAAGAVALENLDPVAGSVTIGHTATLSIDKPDGTALIASTAAFSNTRQLAAFDGTADFAGASSASISEAANIAATATTLTGAALAPFANGAPVTLNAVRTGTTTIDGPGNLDVSTGLQAGGEVDVSYSYMSSDLEYTDTTAGVSGTTFGETYTGPVAGLQWQYIWSQPGAVAIAATTPNAFLKGGAAGDALQVQGGDNVLDGGGGSNFLVGGTDLNGHDTFFVDGREGVETWSTIVNFHSGDQATIFGFHGGRSTMPFTASDGVGDYKGLTLHSELDGAGTGVKESVTFAGIDQATADAHFTLTTGTLPGNIDYLLIQYR